MGTLSYMAFVHCRVLEPRVFSWSRSRICYLRQPGSAVFVNVRHHITWALIFMQMICSNQQILLLLLVFLCVFLNFDNILLADTSLAYLKKRPLILLLLLFITQARVTNMFRYSLPGLCYLFTPNFQKIFFKKVPKLYSNYIKVNYEK